jgi:hypothetical protein
MSALCQKRTSVDLFDDLVGAGEQSSDQTIRPASFGNFAIFTAIRRAGAGADARILLAIGAAFNTWDIRAFRRSFR